MYIRKSEDAVKIETFEAIGILAHEAEPENICLDPLRGDTRDFCRRYVVNEGFRGKAGTSLKIPLADGAMKFALLCGVGKADNDTEENVRAGAFQAVRAAASKGYEKVLLQAPKAGEKSRSRSVAEGAALANYRFDKYMKKDEDDRFKPVEEVVLIDGNEEGLREGVALANGQIYARALANEPGNKIHPQELAQRAEELAKELGLEIEVWDEKRIAQENMGALYAVGRGSAHQPRFIRLTWNPKGEAKDHTVLIGKGITFDSGGLDIKPADFMTTMKGDKSGACSVLGAIRTVAALDLPRKVTVLIAAAENMPGGDAYRPDDILTARNGKTIEINNTDAEGRLTLADALAYASELQPDAIVDIATLTGACAVALGSSTAGLFTNNDAFGDKVLAASKRAGERFWKLPMDDPNLKKQLKSPCADVVNCGSRYGGAITAAMFLEEFVGKDIPWVHLDIAAADFIKEPAGYYTKGASGFGARTLASLLIEG